MEILYIQFENKENYIKDYKGLYEYYYNKANDQHNIITREGDRLIEHNLNAKEWSITYIG